MSLASRKQWSTSSSLKWIRLRWMENCSVVDRASREYCWDAWTALDPSKISSSQKENVGVKTQLERAFIRNLDFRPELSKQIQSKSSSYKSWKSNYENWALHPKSIAICSAFKDVIRSEGMEVTHWRIKTANLEFEYDSVPFLRYDFCCRMLSEICPQNTPKR